jgi:hypothetical protein
LLTPELQVAHAALEELGEAGTLELRDLNVGATAIQRPYVQQVMYCLYVYDLFRSFDHSGRRRFITTVTCSER